MKKAVLGCAGVFVALIVLGAIFSSGGTQDPNNSNTSQSNEQQNTQKEYVKVFEFSGSGTKKSEPFTITGDRFKVEYDCKGDLCQIWSKRVGSDFDLDLVVNQMGSAKDSTVIYKTGEFYFDANSIANFTLVVYDYK